MPLVFREQSYGVLVAIDSLDAAGFSPEHQRLLEAFAVSAATAVATGKNHACALMADRSVACWGAADHGAIGSLFDGGVTAPRILNGLTATALAARRRPINFMFKRK